jgi:hypothetical protein
MCAAELSQILVPPSAPIELPSSHDWLAVDRAGYSVPAEYKQFVSQYGSGGIDGFIWVFNPGSPNPCLNLVAQIERQLDNLRGAQIPGLALYPHQGGLLPFAVTENGDILGWRTRGSPDSWGVTVVDSRAPERVNFKERFFEFIAGVLTREVKCSIFPDDFPSKHPAFVPPS